MATEDDVDVEVGCFVAVDLHAEFGFAGFVGAIEVNEAGDLAKFGQYLARVGVELREVRSLNIKEKLAIAGAARNQGRELDADDEIVVLLHALASLAMS